METLWSMSTTVREAERIVGFLKTAIELEGQTWDKNTQIRFQVLLIKNRHYLNDTENTQTFNKLSKEQSELLLNKNIEMTYEQALDIFCAKKYNDPPMRGRQSMSPLQKLGLVYIVSVNNINMVKITDVGKKLARGEIQFNDFMLDSLLKFQYPNPYEGGFQCWNTKPFINTLRLIKNVNSLCSQEGIKAKGIAAHEFGIFVLSLKSYSDVRKTAVRLLKFRKEYEAITDSSEQNNFLNNYVKKYLSEFKNPIKNINEYTDNMIRYLRLTKYIYIRGKYNHTYIDLEPRRMTEINAILAHDNGAAKTFTNDEWIKYMGTYGTYILQFETIPILTEILVKINIEIAELEKKLGLVTSNDFIPKERDLLKHEIERRRQYRTKLQNLEIKQACHEDIANIDTTIEALSDILNRNKAKLAKKFSIELEKWSHIALNILDDAELIKPNSPVGDDNEPIYTAPSGVPDIECYYKAFGAIAEVTMLTSRDQWYNEGQPVMRHLRTFEISSSTQDNYCIFIAPHLHVDTINTFYNSVKYEYEGIAQKIIPITISQLIRLLKIAKSSIIAGSKMSHLDLKQFYDDCTNITSLKSSTEWLNLIEKKLASFENKQTNIPLS